MEPATRGHRKPAARGTLQELAYCICESVRDSFRDCNINLAKFHGTVIVDAWG